MQRRRLVDRRQSLGRRIVRERRRRTVSVAVDRRSGIDRRTNMLRRSGDERRLAVMEQHILEVYLGWS